jgi:hypothetical protein
MLKWLWNCGVSSLSLLPPVFAGPDENLPPRIDMKGDAVDCMNNDNTLLFINSP